MLAKTALLRYNNYSDKKRVIICVLKGILDVCFSVKLAQQQSRVNQGFTRVFFCLFVVPIFDKSGSNGALFCGARLILCYTLYT